MTSTRTRVGTVLYFGAFEDQQHRWGSTVADTATFPLLQGHPGHQHTPVISTRLLSYAQHTSWDISQPTASICCPPAPSMPRCAWKHMDFHQRQGFNRVILRRTKLQLHSNPRNSPGLHLNLSSFYIKMWPFLYLPPEK